MTVSKPAMAASEVEAYLFAGCEMWPCDYKLFVDGHVADIGSRALDVLRVLIEHAGQAVSRDTLFDLAWPHLVVTDNNLTVQIFNLRRFIGKDVITTVPGIGYRFSAGLEVRKFAAALPSVAARRPGNLPLGQFELIGRQAATDAVAALLDSHRLVTIAGTGGIGKTRLALAVASQLSDRFEQGAWVVELAPLVAPMMNASLLPETVGQALGLSFSGDQPFDKLIVALANDERLILLDNCEHVVEEAARLSAALIARTRNVRILTTSQTILNVASERVYLLRPLAIADAADPALAECDAVRLLVARVEALDSNFRWVEGWVQDAAMICRRLDGLPLAIELAAARVPLLGLAGVRAGLDDRFQLLTRGQRDAPLRQKTLDEALAWSYSLLTDDEKKAFRRAGVFSGSFAGEEAIAVLADSAVAQPFVMGLVGSLAEKSLVIIVGSANPPRYRLLESARAYALKMLAADAVEQTDPTRRRHAQAIDRLFQKAISEEWTLTSQARRALYLPDLDNGRVALRWAVENDHELHIALAGRLAWLFGESGQGTEGLRHCKVAQACMKAQATPAHLEARLQLEMCRLNLDGEDTGTLEFGQRAVDLMKQTGDRRGHYAALGLLAIAAALDGDEGRSESAIRDMEIVLDGAWPKIAGWDLLVARDYLANQRRQFTEGAELAAMEYKVAREHGDNAKLVFAMKAAEQCAASLEHYEDAVERGFEAIAFAERENEVADLHKLVFNCAMSLAMCGRIREALPLARRSAIVDNLRGSLRKGLDLMALLAMSDNLELAARIIGLSEAANKTREPVEGVVYLRVIRRLEQSLPAAQLARLKAEGARMTPKELSEEVVGSLGDSSPEA